MTTRRTFVAGGVSLAGVLATSRLGRRAFAEELPAEAVGGNAGLDSAAMDALGLGWAAAWDATDTSWFAEHVTEDFVHHSGGLCTTLGYDLTLDVFLKSVREARDGFADWALKPSRLSIVAGDLVGYRFTITGTHTGRCFGIPATNKPVSVTGITALRIEGGKVAEAWSAWDGGSVRDQLGVLTLAKVDSSNSAATPIAPTEEVCAPASPEEAIAIAQRYWDVVWGSELTDVAQLGSVASLSVKGHLPGTTPIVGQEALMRRVANWKRCMPDLAFTPIHLWSGDAFVDGAVVTGDFTVTIWEATGTPTGPLPVIDYAGRPDAQLVNWRGVDIFRTNCGKVEEVWSEFDMYRVIQSIRGV